MQPKPEQPTVSVIIPVCKKQRYLPPDRSLLRGRIVQRPIRSSCLRTARRRIMRRKRYGSTCAKTRMYGCWTTQGENREARRRQRVVAACTHTHPCSLWLRLAGRDIWKTERVYGFMRAKQEMQTVSMDRQLLRQLQRKVGHALLF